MSLRFWPSNNSGGINHKGNSNYHLLSAHWYPDTLPTAQYTSLLTSLQVRIIKLVLPVRKPSFREIKGHNQDHLVSDLKPGLQSPQFPQYTTVPLLCHHRQVLAETLVCDSTF